MRVIVTGAAGFLGSALVEELRVKHDIVGVDLLPAAATTSVDLNCLDQVVALGAHESEVIIHLAGVQFLKPVSKYGRKNFFQSNISMASNLCALLEKSNSIRHVIYVSTDMVYGLPARTPVSELAITNPIGEYGASKLAAEDALKATCTKLGVALTIFRPRLIAGQGRQGTIATLKRFIDAGLPVPILGRGANHYQLVHKRDVCSAIQLAMSARKEGVYNLGSDNSPTVSDLLTNVIRESGSKSKLVRLPLLLSEFALEALDFLGCSPLSPEQFKIASVDYILATDKAKLELGWAPTLNDFELLQESTK